MNRLKNNDVTHLIYESYTQYVNEEQENAAPQQYKRLVDFSPNIEGGNLVLYINVHEPDLFGVLPKIITGEGGIIADIEKRRAKRGLPPLTDDEKRAKIREFTTGSVKDKKTGEKDTEYIKFTICTTSQLGSIFDENGQVIDSDEYKTVVNKIYNILQKLQKYNFSADNEQIQSMFKTIFFYGKRLPTKEDIAQIKRNTDDLFFRICNTLGEEETRQLLNTIQFSKENVLSDHQLNFGNRLRIIAQAEEYDKNGGNQLGTISYLATQRQWLKMGRIVVNFDYPYHLDVFHGGRGNQQAEEEVMKQRGRQRMSGWRGKKAQNIETNAEVYGRNTFGYHVYFDISATQPVDGVEDKFTTEPGMINNMTGELNDVATQELQKMGFNSDKDVNNRTSKLNNIFGTTDYNSVDLTYNATCMALGHNPNLNVKNDAQAEIAELDTMLRQELVSRLQKQSGGGIAKADNYRPLVPIGLIFIKGLIGLPLDKTDNVKLSDDYREMAKSLQQIVTPIAKDILDCKRNIINQSNQPTDVSEMISIYSNMFICEELLNKAINILTEDA